MPRDVAVLIELDAQASGLSGLLAALDAQTLSAECFEVILLDGLTSGLVRARLSELAERRTNVRTFSGTVADALHNTQAEWVMVLTMQDLWLRPRALERLLERARSTRSELVLGRVDLADGGVLDDVLARDAAGITVSASAVMSSVVAQRRELALTHGLIVDAVSAETVLAAEPAVTTLGAYQCASRAPGFRGRTASEIAVDSVTTRWANGVLVLAVRGTVGPGTVGDVLIAARAISSKIDFWLPTIGSLDPDGTFQATARFDPLHTSAGGIVPEGRWAFTVGVHGDTPHPSGRARVPRMHGLSHTVVGGRVIVAEARGPHTVLDIGATKTSIIGAIPAADVVITARLLRARLPRVVIETGQPAAGQVLVGESALPARIVRADRHAALECDLAGLTSRARAPLSTRFGSTTRPLGLDLTIAANGVVSVETDTSDTSPRARTELNRAQSPAPVGSALAIDWHDAQVQRSWLVPRIRAVLRQGVTRSASKRTRRPHDTRAKPEGISRPHAH